MLPWLFNVYMDSEMQEMKAWVLGEWVELLHANGGRFQIKQLLFADDTSLLADSEEKVLLLLSPDLG